MTKKLSIGLAASGGLFILFLFGTLFAHALPSLGREGWTLLTVAHWNFRQSAFGALAMIYGTCVVSFVALALAFPVGLGAAIFVSEILAGKTRAAAKMTIELLAGIPSVVYGLLGVVFLRQWLQDPLTRLGASSGDSLFTAGLLLALMILPTMMTFSDDALRCVPRLFRETARGLGLTRRQAVWHVVLPQARSGILGAALLSLGRAIGETIAVYLVIGRADRPLPRNILSVDAWIDAGQTLTTKLGGAETAIAYGDSRHWSALMALGASLWIAIAFLTYASERLFLRQGRMS